MPSSTKTRLIELQRQIYRQASRPGGLAAMESPYSLLDAMINRNNLMAAWERVCTTDGARTPGLDGEITTEVSGRLGRWLDFITTDLAKGRYRPSEPRWVDIPKRSGSVETRRIGILTLRDRVVHTAIKQVLEPVLEPQFHRDSYGFRPGRSVCGALSEVCRTLASGQYTFALKADVAQCFDTIDHKSLLDRLVEPLADEQLHRLVRSIASASASGTQGWLRRQVCGLLQGSSLSPLLCNFHLHPLDIALSERTESTQQGVRAFRYADDVLILSRTTSMARAARRLAGRVLSAGGQRLSSAKTRLRKIRNGFDWLGVTICPRPSMGGTSSQFGYIVPDAKVSQMLERIDEITEPPSRRIDVNAFKLGKWIVSVNRQLKDWRQAYLFADNASLVFRTLDEHTYRRVSDLLYHVTGSKANALRRDFGVKLPRGFRSWSVEGCRLTVLSSLAPQNPNYLTRKPEWMRPPKRSKPIASTPNRPLEWRLIQSPNGSDDSAS